MTRPGPEPASIALRSATVQVVLASAILALSGLLLVDPAIDGSDASAGLGLVLAEAIALYLGYGAVTRVAGPPVRGLLASG